MPFLIVYSRARCDLLDPKLVFTTDYCRMLTVLSEKSTLPCPVYTMS